MILAETGLHGASFVVTVALGGSFVSVSCRVHCFLTHTQNQLLNTTFWGLEIWEVYVALGDRMRLDVYSSRDKSCC